MVYHAIGFFITRNDFVMSYIYGISGMPILLCTHASMEKKFMLSGFGVLSDSCPGREMVQGPKPGWSRHITITGSTIIGLTIWPLPAREQGFLCGVQTLIWVLRFKRSQSMHGTLLEGVGFQGFFKFVPSQVPRPDNVSVHIRTMGSNYDFVFMRIFVAATWQYLGADSIPQIHPP